MSSMNEAVFQRSADIFWTHPPLWVHNVTREGANLVGTFILAPPPIMFRSDSETTGRNERVYWIMISGRFNKVGWEPRDLIILRRIIQPILNKFGKVLVIVHVTTGMSEPFTFRQ